MFLVELTLGGKIRVCAVSSCSRREEAPQVEHVAQRLFGPGLPHPFIGNESV